MPLEGFQLPTHKTGFVSLSPERRQWLFNIKKNTLTPTKDKSYFCNSEKEVEKFFRKVSEPLLMKTSFPGILGALPALWGRIFLRGSLTCDLFLLLNILVSPPPFQQARTSQLAAVVCIVIKNRQNCPYKCLINWLVKRHFLSLFVSEEILCKF